MQKTDLKLRPKKFAVETIKFLNTLPKSKANNVLTYQLVKSSTSVAANYRSALRGRSTAEFISKLNIVLEEADESLLWFEIIEETNENVSLPNLSILKSESNELTAIFTSSLKTARNNTKSKNLTSKI